MLDQHGQIRLVQPHQISMRRDSIRAIATDSEGHELRVNDNVKEVDGEVCVFRQRFWTIFYSTLYRGGKDGFYTFISPSLHSFIIGKL